MNLAYTLFTHTDYLILDYQNMGATNIKSLNKLLSGIVKKDDMQTFLMLVYFGPCTNIYDRNGDLLPLMLYLMLIVTSKLNPEERTALMLTIELDNIRVTRIVARTCKKETRLRCQWFFPRRNFTYSHNF